MEHEPAMKSDKSGSSFLCALEARPGRETTVHRRSNNAGLAVRKNPCPPGWGKNFLLTSPFIELQRLPPILMSKLNAIGVETPG
jgi:hypothetical protein